MKFPSGNFRFPALLSVLAVLVLRVAAADLPTRPHIVFVMADDMGWGETSYNGHPLLKTPHLDAMAAAGLRFDRFYAGAPNCSPTRATVMTGRSNDRTGVENHGFALRRQEKTLPAALRAAGYVTGHFGKWHLNGYRGPGAPILGTDTHHPGAFGFDEWLSVTNFFDRDPLLSRQGKIEEFKGDSCEVVVAEALTFLRRHRDGGKPTFSVIWFGPPHAPFNAVAEDKAAFAELAPLSQNHYGELVALDRSIGNLRRGLRELGLAEQTLLVFCSDNGGLPEIQPSTVGGLRGFKSSVYEGGLRVPAIFEWPGVIAAGRRTGYPAGTVDLFPTVAALVKLPAAAMLAPVDGSSLLPLFAAEPARREKALPFRHQRRGAWIESQYKLVTLNVNADTYELYDLLADPGEKTNLAAEKPEVLARLKADFRKWNDSVNASVAGADYPEGKLLPGDPASRDWQTAPEYAPYLAAWANRPELQPAPAKQAKKKKQ